MADRELHAATLWSLDALLGDLRPGACVEWGDSGGPRSSVGLPIAAGALSGPFDREVLALVDAATARAADEAAVAAGASWDSLMWTAAGHLARTVRKVAGRAYGLQVAIVVGRGNNGGDGWAAARRLTVMGAKVRVIAPEGADAPTTDLAGKHRDWWLAHGGPLTEGVTGLPETLANWAEVTVDAMLGTGARGAPRDALADATGMLADAQHRTCIVACDLPTGVDSDDGSVAGPAVSAQATVTFGALKRGLVLPPGSWHAGSVFVGGLGPHWHPAPADFSSPVEDSSAVEVPVRLQTLTARGARPEPLRPGDDKWARGKVLVVAGSPGMAGAAALTADAALRTGAGLVQVATPAAIAASVAAHTDAGVMVRGIDTNDWRAERAGNLVVDLLAWEPDVVVVGPGLGVGATSTALVTELVRRAPRVVADADALNVARDNLALLGGHRGALVVTPQPRELARLTGRSDAWQRRLDVVPRLAEQLDATVVAKGPGTLVVPPDGRGWVVAGSVPALGSGGTGDVLAGMIAAAIARCEDIGVSAARATWWHAAAGRRAGAKSGGRATASAVLAEVPDVLQRLDG